MGLSHLWHIEEYEILPSKADPCIWLRKAPNLRCYEYIAVYVDDLCIAAESPSAFVSIFNTKYHLKVKRDGKLNYHLVVEFWGLPPLILFFNMSIGWFGRFALSTECYRTRKLGYKDLNWPRCSARVTESLALTDGGFCQKQTLYILDYVNIVSL